MKKNVIILSIIVVIALVIAILFFLLNNKGMSDGERFKQEYEELNDSHLEVKIDSDNMIKYIGLEEAIDIIKNDTGVIYFGYPSCPWCRNAVPVLLDAASSTSLDTIYYVNAYNIRDVKEIDDDGNIVTTNEGDRLYDDLLGVLDDILDPYTITDDNGEVIDLGEKRLYVPMVLFVKDGEVVSYHLSTVDSQEDPSISLNDSQRDELYNIYLDGINNVVGGVCNVQESGSC